MVAPIENPVNLAPASGTTNLDEQVQAQTTLDPGNVGDDIQARMDEVRRTATLEAQNAAAQVQQASQKEIGGLKESLAEMRGQMAALAQAGPQQPAGPTLEEKYGYTQEEHTELGQMIPAAIDKRGEYWAEKAKEEALAAAEHAFNLKVNSMQETINQLQAAVTANSQQHVDQFEMQAQAIATAHGIDLNTVGETTEWKTLMGQPANQITGETYGQIAQAAIQNRDARTLDSVLRYFKSTQQPQSSAPTGVPFGSGGARPEGAPPNMLPAAGAASEQAVAIYQEMEDLRDQIARRKIGPQAFSKQMAELEEKIAALEAA